MAQMKHHEYASLFPMMPEAELQTLAADIAKNGQLEPIITLFGEILDGRNRERACQIAGVEPWYKAYEGNDPLAFVVSHNLHRRHLDESQRSMVAARLKNMPRGGNQHPSIDGCSKVTQREAQELLNVGESSVTRAAKIQRQGVPELIQAVADGKIAVGAAYKVADLSSDEQRALVEQGPPAVREKAAEMKRQGSPQPEPETKTESNRVPAFRPNHARDCWNLAKVQFDRILPQDVSRIAVLNEAKAYIEARLAKNI